MNRTLFARIMFLNVTKNKLIYLLKDSQIVERQYSELENFYYYEDWLKIL